MLSRTHRLMVLVPLLIVAVLIGCKQKVEFDPKVEGPSDPRIQPAMQQQRSDTPKPAPAD